MSETVVHVRVTAGAKSENVEKLPSGIFRIRTNVTPEKGKANERVRKLLAEYLKVPHMAVYIKSGHTSREKVFIIED